MVVTAPDPNQIPTISNNQLIKNDFSHHLHVACIGGCYTYLIFLINTITTEFLADS